jgi:hypothetical protein
VSRGVKQASRRQNPAGFTLSASHSSSRPYSRTSPPLMMCSDSPLVCRISEVALVFFFISIVFAPVARVIERIAPLHAGRSPPLSAIS